MVWQRNVLGHDCVAGLERALEVHVLELVTQIRLRFEQLDGPVLQLQAHGQQHVGALVNFRLDDAGRFNSQVSPAA
jgi:hypothetical protein